MRLAVARHYTAGENGAPGQWRWRAGGLMIQHLARAGGTEARRRSDRRRRVARARTTTTGSARASSRRRVEDHELLDPTLSPERLLYRLFHEEGVRAFPAAPIEAYCRCSRERIEAFLRSFGAEELADMREPDGAITVTCEFCTKTIASRPTRSRSGAYFSVFR